MKRKLLLAALCVVSALGMRAQTDVTSTYLSNADFSQGTLASPAICTYAKDISTNNTTYANLVALDGWTAVDNGDGKAGGPVAIGSGVWIGGAGYTAPSTNSDGDATGNVLGVVGCWSASAQYKQTLKTGLPAGTYTIVVAVYNSVGGTNEISKNLIGFVEGGGTEHLASTKKYPVNTWKYEYITFTLTAETSGYVTLGYKSAHTGSGNMPHLFISGLEIYEGEVDAAAYEAAKAQKRAKGEWGVAKASAQTALDNSDYAIVTGKERTDLEAEIAKAEPTTVEGYNEATEALVAATATFTAAKAAYDGLASLWNNGVPELIYATTEKYTAIGDAYFGEGDVVDAADATARTAAMQTAIRAYYESHAMAEKVDGAVNMTDRVSAANADTNTGWTNGIGTNQGQGYTDADGNVASKYLDGGWASNAGANIDMTRNVEIPAGKYLLTVTARGSVDLDVYTLSIGGQTINLPHANGGSNGVFGNGWEDASIEFETDGTNQTLEIIATSTASQQWISINRFRLVRLELYTEMAKAADYEAMNTALTAAKAKTLGFAAGEFAPYNNVDAIKAIAQAEAVDTEAENAKEDIEAITTALGNWTANTTEVNGIYNGDWALSTPNATSGVDVDVPGWTLVQGMRMVIGDTTTDPGLEYASANKALFSWGGTTITYGEQTGYTLPLEENTVYEVSYLISAWRDGDVPTWVSLTVDGATVYGDNGISAPGKINAAEGNPFKTVTFKFKTGEAKDYVVKIFANKHFTITDITLTKAPEATANMKVKAEKWGTFIAPFDVTIPAGIKAYTVSGVDENGYMVKEEVETTIPANTPVVLENTNEEDFESKPDFSGQSLATKDSYTEGALTGVYTAATIPASEGNTINYVLQTQGDVQAFYKVTSDFTAVPNRCYLTVEKTNAAAPRAIFISEDGDATGIQGVDGQIAKGNVKGIYSANGTELNQLQKGLNIVKMADGKVKKVYVK